MGKTGEAQPGRTVTSRAGHLGHEKGGNSNYIYETRVASAWAESFSLGRPRRNLSAAAGADDYRRFMAVMMPPTTTESTTLPMIEMRIGDPKSARTMLITTRIRMKTKN